MGISSFVLSVLHHDAAEIGFVFKFLTIVARVHDIAMPAWALVNGNQVPHARELECQSLRGEGEL